MMMKAYLIPGAFEDLKSRNYQAILEAYKKSGYQAQFIEVDWKYKTIEDWVKQVRNAIPKEDLPNSLLSGFSWGAMIALAVAAEASPKQLFLFSLSPYFAEDLPHVKKPWFKWAGKHRTAAFKSFYMNELAAKIDCPTTLFIGSKEVSKYSDVKKRTNEAHKRIKNSRKVEIKGVGHDVADLLYIEAIKKELRNT
jgi:pimeloyl-ACP methyl ester carboxylesterase